MRLRALARPNFGASSDRSWKTQNLPSQKQSNHVKLKVGNADLQNVMLRGGKVAVVLQRRKASMTDRNRESPTTTLVRFQADLAWQLFAAPTSALRPSNWPVRSHSSDVYCRWSTKLSHAFSGEDHSSSTRCISDAIARILTLSSLELPTTSLGMASRGAVQAGRLQSIKLQLHGHVEPAAAKRDQCFSTPSSLGPMQCPLERLQ